MAIFGRKKEEQTQGKSPKVKDRSEANKKDQTGLIDQAKEVEEVIKHPRITEKATDVSEDHNVYTFDVRPGATKQEIKKAIKKLYKVEPVKVRTAAVPKKPTTVRGVKKSFKPGGRKAYVYLKQGDTIEFV